MFNKTTSVAYPSAILSSRGCRPTQLRLICQPRAHLSNRADTIGTTGASPTLIISTGILSGCAVCQFQRRSLYADEGPLTRARLLITPADKIGTSRFNRHDSPNSFDSMWIIMLPWYIRDILDPVDQIEKLCGLTPFSQRDSLMNAQTLKKRFVIGIAIRLILRLILHT